MLQEILESEFTEDGIIVSESVDFTKAYRFVFEAIMDSHLPICKPIGYRVDMVKSKFLVKNATERNTGCLECPIEVAKNLSDKLVADYVVGIAVTSKKFGRIDINEDFKISQRPVQILGETRDILTCSDEVILKLFLSIDTGYRDMKANAWKINNKSFFPLYSYHNLRNYCRVLPPDNSGKIKLRFHDGYNKDMLQQAFIYLAGYKAQGKLSEEDMTWVLRYDL